MSFAEITLVLLLAFLLFDLKDFESIIKELAKIFREISKFKNQLTNELENLTAQPKQNDLINNISQNTEANIIQINQYLSKIIEFGGQYQGEYELDQIKKYYFELLNSQNKSS